MREMRGGKREREGGGVEGSEGCGGQRQSYGWLVNPSLVLCVGMFLDMLLGLGLLPCAQVSW